MGCREVAGRGSEILSGARDVFSFFSSFIENNDIWALSKFTFRGLKSLTHL